MTLADSHAIYAYNPAMAVVMLLPEKRFVCVPCVAALRIIPFELKNSSGEIIKPRGGVLFRSEVVSLLAGSFLKLDGSDSDFDGAVVEVNYLARASTPGPQTALNAFCNLKIILVTGRGASKRYQICKITTQLNERY